MIQLDAAFEQSAIATMTEAMAPVMGQSNTVMACCSSSIASIEALVPPSICGVTNDAAVSANTMVTPAASPGALSGRVTRRNARHGGAPSMRAASTRYGLMRASEV